MPSSTVSFANSKPAARGANSTQSHARHLRTALESLNELQRERTQAVARAKRLAESDDITQRILRAATAIEQWTEVQPAMFEDILDDELAKFDKFRVQLEEGEREQNELLDAVKVCFSDPILG